MKKKILICIIIIILAAAAVVAWLEAGNIGAAEELNGFGSEVIDSEVEEVPPDPNLVEAENLMPEEPELVGRMVMVDGTLYQQTYIVSHTLRCGVLDGEITSTVEAGEKPTENDQSNFGTGYEYQRGPKGTIQINMDDKWWIFAEEEVSWGITLSAKNVTSTGLTIVCEQAGGNPTGELQTGSYYILETLQDGTWNEVDCIAQVAWTSEAWIITQDSTVSWDVDWEWLYRKLSPGIYRIGKNIMDFRGAGDYDSKMFYAEFAIIE